MQCSEKNRNRKNSNIQKILSISLIGDISLLKSIAKSLTTHEEVPKVVTLLEFLTKIKVVQDLIYTPSIFCQKGQRSSVDDLQSKISHRVVACEHKGGDAVVLHSLTFSPTEGQTNGHFRNRSDLPKNLSFLGKISEFT